MLTLCIGALLVYVAGAVLFEFYSRRRADRDLLPIKNELEYYFGREVKMSELELEYDRMIVELKKIELEDYLGHRFATDRLEHEYDRMLGAKKQSTSKVEGRRGARLISEPPSARQIEHRGV